VAQEVETSTAGPSSSISGVKVAHTAQRTTVRITGSGEIPLPDNPPGGSGAVGPGLYGYELGRRQAYGAQQIRPRTWCAIVAVEAWPIACGDRSFQFVPYNVQANGSELAISFVPAAAALLPAALPAARKPVKQNLASPKVPQIPLPPSLPERSWHSRACK